MSFIAIDISLDNFNLLIGNKSKIIFSKTEKVYKDRSNILFETLHYIQNEKIFDFKNIEKIYSTIGPGNYNGIRISISAIKAFKLVYQKLNIFDIIIVSLDTDWPSDLKTKVDMIEKHTDFTFRFEQYQKLMEI